MREQHAWKDISHIWDLKKVQLKILAWKALYRVKKTLLSPAKYYQL